MRNLYQGSGLRNQEVKSPHRELVKSIRIAVPLVGLAAILAASTQTEVGRSAGRSVSRYFGNVLDNAIYGKDVTSQKYITTTYQIKPKDTSDTLREMTGNNEMAYDFILFANSDIDPEDLKPGMRIIIPMTSTEGKTIPELFEELKLKNKK